MIVQRVLSEGTFTLRELAASSDVKYQTLRTWAAGLSAPRPDSLRQLAAGLRRRGEKLEELAGELEKAAGNEEA